MKYLSLFVLHIIFAGQLIAQSDMPPGPRRTKITELIYQYSQARENRDTFLLKSILTASADQLVSSGEWREGVSASVQGMLQSSVTTPGARRLTIEKMKLLGTESALVDCKYELQNKDGTARKMWSTFVVVLEEKAWKITAIRNMLPAAQ